MNDITSELAQELLITQEYITNGLTNELAGLAYSQYVQAKLFEHIDGEGMEAVIADLRELYMRTGAMSGVLGGIIHTYEQTKDRE